MVQRNYSANEPVAGSAPVAARAEERKAGRNIGRELVSAVRAVHSDSLVIFAKSEQLGYVGFADTKAAQSAIDKIKQEISDIQTGIKSAAQEYAFNLHVRGETAWTGEGGIDSKIEIAPPAVMLETSHGTSVKAGHAPVDLSGKTPAAEIARMLETLKGVLGTAKQIKPEMIALADAREANGMLNEIYAGMSGLESRIVAAERATQREFEVRHYTQADDDGFPPAPSHHSPHATPA